MKTMQLKSSTYSGFLTLAFNILLVYVTYTICRIAFLFENWSILSEGWENLDLGSATIGALMFDTSAIVYTNAFYLLLTLLPLPVRDNPVILKIAKWYYIIVNSIAMLINLVDSVYFAYTNKRTTCSVFQEFGNDGGTVAGTLLLELVKHWYLVLLLIGLIYMLWKLYLQPVGKTSLPTSSSKLKYYIPCVLIFAAMSGLCVAGARGGFTADVRPITLSNANKYVNRPCEASLILNTPFSLLRTISSRTFKNPQFLPEEDVDKIFSPYHCANDSATINNKNVVVFILESFGREYTGFYNKTLDNGTYKGFTPFLDSLMENSLTFEYTFANGRKSIDGMPSALSSIPYFIEHFFLTPYSLNKLSGIANELKTNGYYTAFFHGAPNGSMGFEAYARSTGYDDYYGMTEYCEDPRFNGKDDFDGHWAIWDEEFLQYYALKMSEFKQPFMTSVFTASSHHPFSIPERYKNKFVDEDSNPLHKCIRCSDNALRRFFDTAKEQDWFKNTIFVFTSDHTNMADHDYYKSDLGLYAITLFIYDASGEIKPQRRQAIAQQIDIMPTVLGYLGYSKDYIAYGIDLLKTKDEDTWAVNYQTGLYQYFKGDYMIQMTEDGTLKSVFAFKQDSLLKNNLVDSNLPEVDSMQIQLKAIVQSYMNRMVADSLRVEH